jgi:hypothetical protein
MPGGNPDGGAAVAWYMVLRVVEHDGEGATLMEEGWREASGPDQAERSYRQEWEERWRDERDDVSPRVEFRAIVESAYEPLFSAERVVEAKRGASRSGPSAS